MRRPENRDIQKQQVNHPDLQKEPWFIREMANSRCGAGKIHVPETTCVTVTKWSKNERNVSRGTGATLKGLPLATDGQYEHQDK